MTVGFLWLPQLMFWAITLPATITRAQPTSDIEVILPAEIINFVDTDTCYDGLAQADANGDDRVEIDEFLTFVQLIGPPGFLADIDSLADSPSILQGIFRVLSCLCRQNVGDAQCCIGENAHIPIDGVNDGETPDSSQASFLFLICSSTNRSINIVLEENKSSRTPSTSPTISPAPSPMPYSAIPKVTPEPTQSPSFLPSVIPAISTRLPKSPSSPPTSIPSAVPSTQPPSMYTTAEGIGVVARTIYTVVIVNGITENVPVSFYVPDLIASMNVVAVEVASEVDFGTSDGRRRRLEVRVSLPTFIDGVVDGGGFTDTPEFVDGVFELGGMCSRGFKWIGSNYSEKLFSPTHYSYSLRSLPFRSGEPRKGSVRTSHSFGRTVS